MGSPVKSLTGSIPPLSARDTAGVLADVIMPLFARGVIIRRPRVAGLLDRLDADARAVRRLQIVRARYWEGPVLLRTTGARCGAGALRAGHARRPVRVAPAVQSRERREA